MSRIREGIREDGTIEDCFVETHFLPLEYGSVVSGPDGYFRFVADGGAINYEIRVPIEEVERALVKRSGAES